MKDIESYKTISNEVWKVFRSTFPEGSDLTKFTDEVALLDKKYKDVEGYRFMQKLLKVYFEELVEVKG